MAVAIKICYAYHLPPSRKSWASAASYMNVVIHVPHRCLVRTCIVKEVVRFAVGVKVSWCRGRTRHYYVA